MSHKLCYNILTKFAKFYLYFYSIHNGYKENYGIELLNAYFLKCNTLLIKISYLIIKCKISVVQF